MTNLTPCAWCGDPVPAIGTGRPRRYCRRSHRQRAYEARQAGVARGLGPGEAIVAVGALQALADARYVLSTALVDAAGDLAADGDPLDAYEHVAAAARGVLETRVEPVAVAGA